MKYAALVLCIFLMSCAVAGVQVLNPYTSIPAAALGVYEQTQKRERLEKYAIAGDVYAQHKLAESYCCSHGLDGAVDNKKSLYWYCKAAKGGLAKAQQFVADLHSGAAELEGVSVPQDEGVAYMWYVFASRKLNSPALERKKFLEQALEKKQISFVNRFLTNASDVPCGMELATPEGASFE